jgi:putative flippase GtrA
MEVPLPVSRRLLLKLVRLFEAAARILLRRLERLEQPWSARLARLLRDREFWRFVRFLAVGSLNFAFYYTIFATLHLLDVEPTQAVILATIVAVLFNFCTTGRIVFGYGRFRLLPRFIGVYAVQLVANVFSLKALINIGVPVLIAEALVIGVLAIATFFALRRFVFASALLEPKSA